MRYLATLALWVWVVSAYIYLVRATVAYFGGPWWVWAIIHAFPAMAILGAIGIARVAGPAP